MSPAEKPAERPAAGAAPAMPPLDQAFIESNQLIERYLEGKLPYKGGRDLEAWCRAHPEYLQKLRLGERAVASLKLLEASGNPADLTEPRTPWWSKPHALIAACLVAVAALVGCLLLSGKITLLSGRLEDAAVKLRQGTLAPPGSVQALRIAPDRTAEAGAARLTVNRNVPQLIDLSIDMSFSTEKRFRITVDKRDQARVLVLGDLVKDSNGNLRVTFNTSALSAGPYDVRIQALPLLGEPIDAGWMVLDVH
jgi:hypothetical protein